MFRIAFNSGLAAERKENVFLCFSLGFYFFLRVSGTLFDPRISDEDSRWRTPVNSNESGACPSGRVGFGRASCIVAKDWEKKGEYLVIAQLSVLCASVMGCKKRLNSTQERLCELTTGLADFSRIRGIRWSIEQHLQRLGSSVWNRHRHFGHLDRAEPPAGSAAKGEGALA